MQQECKFVVVPGKPNETLWVKSGPFVMHSQQKTMEAFNDYQGGRLAKQ
ncbi:hypothetical protein KL866_14935 [Alteromonas sp. ALT199]|nr:pirin-like C-terminal cupin domain-containing protein [Alteromonas sp. ALT199]MBT3136369.1 hypothetical protein [Alteromonas sp. ALT199]